MSYTMADALRCVGAWLSLFFASLAFWGYFVISNDGATPFYYVPSLVAACVSVVVYAVGRAYYEED